MYPVVASHNVKVPLDLMGPALVAARCNVLHGKVVKAWQDFHLKFIIFWLISLMSFPLRSS